MAYRRARAWLTVEHALCTRLAAVGLLVVCRVAGYGHAGALVDTEAVAGVLVTLLLAVQPAVHALGHEDAAVGVVAVAVLGARAVLETVREVCRHHTNRHGVQEQTGT